MKYKDSKKKVSLGKGIAYISLVVAFILPLLLIMPTIGGNTNDPNMIVYFNSDEGGLMDIIWSYYSGEKRESFQWDADWGLEMLYLSDFARLVLSRFMKINPGTFVFILRWIHLIAWILLCFVLYGLVKRHFGNAWQPALAVILLAVRPAFPLAYEHLKPEPLVWLTTIIGLHYSLNIIGKPSRRNLFMSVGCASAAFLLKYAGIFLLPAILAAMFFARRYNDHVGGEKNIFPEIKISWIMPALAGLVLITMPLSTVFFYVRKSTGFTWYEQFGLLDSLLQNRLILYMCLMGVFLICLSFLILVLNKNQILKTLMGWINRLNSYLLVILSIFSGFVLLFGVRWLITPRHFINAYAQIGPTATSSTSRTFAMMASGEGIIAAFLDSLGQRIMSFDPIIFILFCFYLIVEVYHHRVRKRFNSRVYTSEIGNKDLLQGYKRLVLLIFLIPLFIIIFFTVRIAEDHMLPFFAAASILSIQGLDMVRSTFSGRKAFGIILTCLISVLFIADISTGAKKIIQSRFYRFRQHEDVAYEIRDWLLKNIPPDTRIVADHYKRAYIPPEFNNVETLNWNEAITTRRIAELVREYRPKIVYYNENTSKEDGGPVPPLEEILPDKNVRMVKSFESKPDHYERRRGARFVVYEVH